MRRGQTVGPLSRIFGRGLDVRACVARLRRGLAPREVWQFPPTEAGNVVVLAHGGDVPAESVLAARAADIERRWDLPARDWLGMARRTAQGDRSHDNGAFL